MLDIYAGSNALKTIQEQGFKQELFTNFLGASGGPKWFTLFGLDKYLFGDFFNERTTELNVIGSSAGAFRAACFAQNDPVAAITRLADKYARTQYGEKPSAADISQSAIDMLAHLFDSNGIDEIINNPTIKAHFIVAKNKGLTGYENKLIQGAGLLGSILLNKIDRRLLTWQYERYIYRPSSSDMKINDPYGFTSHYVDFTQDNIGSALLASGSIPLVMSGIKDIHGSPKGMYRDGGIIDYHFDFSLSHENQAEGLTLYPHFSPVQKAGWFDKNSSRQVLSKNYQNTVLLVPSAKFIESLPYQKIPDRNDFKNLEANTRIKYWLTVLSETDRLADNLNEFIIKQDIGSIKTFTL
ncbi:MAG: patatin-like phospholipase family protein [Colwellia sp.]|nr:patatin-like phospholipase family protein [Colwellia sp.]